MATGPTNQQGAVPQPGSTSPVGQPIGPLPADTAVGTVAQVIPVWANFHFLLDEINELQDEINDLQTQINNLKPGGGGGITQILTLEPVFGGPITTTGTLGVHDFLASGPKHFRGTVPDPGAIPGITRFLREDATWATPPGGSTGVTSVTGTAPIVVTNPTTTPNVSILTFGASGATHSRGAVPDPGSSAGTNHFLREDATWAVPAGGLVSPLTTKGDIWGYSSTDARIPVGTDAQVLQSDSSVTLGVSWTTLLYGAIGVDFFYYGDGSDGDVTISTAVIIARDMFYHNLTITSTGSLNMKGWRLHVSGVLDISTALKGAIAWPAAAGSPGLAGTGGAPGAAITGNTVGSGNSGSAGGTPASTNPGISTGNSPSLTNSAGGIGGRGGVGGTGSSGAVPGTTGTAGTITNLTNLHVLVHDLYVAMQASIITAGTGGTGGSGGSGNAGGFGGGGGGGGCGGGVVAVFARTINRSSLGPAGIINSDGGLGGLGFTPSISNAGGGGGGAGGGGGYAYLVYSYTTGTACTNLVTCNGGSGANGGNGNGGGAGGNGGDGGSSGRLMSFNLSAGVLIEVLSTAAGTGGSAHSGTSGGAGGGGGFAGATV
jgi:hypothetical protein